MLFSLQNMADCLSSIYLDGAIHLKFRPNFAHDLLEKSCYHFVLLFNHTREKLLDSDWLRHCEFIRNLRANSVIRGKLQISRAKSVIHSECKYKQELRINN